MPRKNQEPHGPTPEEKGAAQKEFTAEEKQQADNMVHPNYTVEMFEEVLVDLAWLSKVDGLPALEQFERCERAIEVMKRVEALLVSKGIRECADYIKYSNKKARLWAAFMSSRCETD